MRSNQNANTELSRTKIQNSPEISVPLSIRHQQLTEDGHEMNKQISFLSTNFKIVACCLKSPNSLQQLIR